MTNIETIKLLNSMKSEPVDYGELVGAPSPYVHAEPQDYAIDVAIKALGQQDKERWIPVSENLPDTETPVLITFREHMEYNGNYRYGICKAIYIPEHTIKSEDLWSYCDNDDLEIYDEKEDTYYAKDGWYEVVEHWDDYSHVAINCEVTAWRLIPEPYKPK